MSNIDPKLLFNENVEKMRPISMDFNMTYVIIATGIAGLLVAILVYWLLSNLKKPVPSDFISSVPITSRQGINTPRGNRSQLRTGQISDDESDEDSDAARERYAKESQSKKKIGVKKMAKLEMKAEKKAAREAMVIEREEKKREQDYKDHLRKLEDEREKQLEQEREEKERLDREELIKKEHEEYLELAEKFEIEEEGYDHDQDVDSEQKLADFIKFVNDSKVVQLEDVASHFKMKTRDVISRIQELIENGSLTGIIDDRGKFISITNEELDSVAKFIRQRGRVTVTDLVVNSNKLINLNTRQNVCG